MAKNGRFIKVSPSCIKILGYTPEELTTQDFMSFIHPEDIDATVIALTFLDENCSISNFKNRFRHKTENRWVTIEWSAKKDVNADLIYASGVDKSDEDLYHISIINSIK